MAVKATKGKPVLYKSVQRKKEAFLAAYSELASISAAARYCQISRTEHYVWMRDDVDYVTRFETAKEVAVDSLEDEAVRRGKHGIDKPVFQGGQLVGKIREYSDTLLIFLLKAARPTKFRDKFIVIPAKQGDGKTPDGVVWVGSEESSTEPRAQAKVKDDSIN